MKLPPAKRVREGEKNFALDAQRRCQLAQKKERELSPAMHP